MLHAHHSPSTLQSPLRHLHTGSGSSHGGSPVSVAARPQQANRCWPRAYLIPPGIVLILVSHAFDPRYRAPVTLPPLLHCAGLGDQRSTAPDPAAICPPCSRRRRRNEQDNTAPSPSHETNRSPGRGGPLLLRPYAGRNGDRLVLLVVLVTCRSASTSISPPSARRRCKKQQHCSSCAPLSLYLAWPSCLACLACLAC